MAVQPWCHPYLIIFYKCHKISVVPWDYERFWVCLVLAVLSPLQVNIYLFNGYKVLNIGILIYFFLAVTMSCAVSVCEGPTVKLCRQSFSDKCILHLASFVILLLACDDKKMWHGDYALQVLCMTSRTVLETVQTKCFSCFCHYEHSSWLLVKHFWWHTALLIGDTIWVNCRSKPKKGLDLLVTRGEQCTRKGSWLCWVKLLWKNRSRTSGSKFFLASTKVHLQLMQWYVCCTHFAGLFWVRKCCGTARIPSQFSRYCQDLAM